jgi:hypothetical protein
VQLIAWFQQRVERPMMGRVMSVLMFAPMGVMPFSLAAAGAAVKWRLPGTFIIAGVMVLEVTLFAASHQLAGCSNFPVDWICRHGRLSIAVQSQTIGVGGYALAENPSALRFPVLVC